MAYSVTGFRASPDIGFRSAHCHTAEGAREVAVTYLADGLQEIEVRDHRGNLCSQTRLERIAYERGEEELGAAGRLAALG